MEEECFETERQIINQDESLNDAKEFFEVCRKKIGEELRFGDNIVQVDFLELAAYNPELSEDLINRPEETVQLLELALEELEWAPNNARVRLSNLTKSQEVYIRNIRSKHLGKMISIEGTIRQASETRPITTNIKWECPSCGTIISVLQIDKHIKEPSRCSCGRRGSFKEIAKDMVDARVLTVEECSENVGRSDQPKKMTIFLKEDLTSPSMEDRTPPGARVKVIGVLKEIEILRGQRKLTRYDLAIETNNIIPLEENPEDIEISDEDKAQIEEISKREDLLEYLSKSVAPSVYGNEKIKKALLLQLFGGVSKKKIDGSTTRKEIHGLLVGDPGVAKSVIMKYLKELCCKSRYVSGKGTSAAGLTATVSPNEATGEWSLEAGAIVLANNGHLFIDEFEKMSKDDRSNLHEAMEHGTLHISKATIQATLNAHTTVLAAANPKYSRFDESQPLANQINLETSLLSRFDFIFVMRDIPNELRDEMIADRLLEDVDEVSNDFLDKDIFKKYIAYAKQLTPKISKDASAMIKKYYVGLRNRIKTVEGKRVIPIGARQFEGIMRLSEASAKLKLRNEVTEKDVIIAIDVIESYLKEVGYDNENNTFDIDKLSGNSTSQRSKIEIVKESIKILENKSGKMIQIDNLYELLKDKISQDELDSILVKIVQSGDAFRPKRGVIQLL